MAGTPAGEGTMKWAIKTADAVPASEGVLSKGPEAVEFILNHAEVSSVAVMPANLPALLKSLPKCTEHVKTVISMGAVDEESSKALKDLGIKALSWEDALKEVLLSTTGEPKGVLLTHRALLAAIAGNKDFVAYNNINFGEDEMYLSYLPLAHIFDRSAEELITYFGGAIGFWRGDVKLLTEDIAELRPTFFCGVPRIFDRIYAGVKAKVEAAGGISKFLFDLAYSRKQARIRAGVAVQFAAPISDAIVFNKIKARLGGRVKAICSGAAPLAPPRGGVPKDHHVLPRGARIWSHRNQRQWVYLVHRGHRAGRHGDVGEWQADGSMKIVDRKKNIFKLAQGEYVAVENLENVYGNCSAIDMLRGGAGGGGGAEPAALEAWAKGAGVEGDYAALCQTPQAKKFILEKLCRDWEEGPGEGRGDGQGERDGQRERWAKGEWRQRGEKVRGERWEGRQEEEGLRGKERRGNRARGDGGRGEGRGGRGTGEGERGGRLKGFEMVKGVHLDSVPFECSKRPPHSHLQEEEASAAQVLPRSPLMPCTLRSKHECFVLSTSASNSISFSAVA
ncbi:unnamed protein product [Closterium sp. NIES-65]|nr:unnamed protein product [Closterium sp. NIES-65]